MNFKKIYLEKGEPDRQFWGAYRAEKELVKSMGFNVAKYDDKWYVYFWSKDDETFEEFKNRFNTNFVNLNVLCSKY